MLKQAETIVTDVVDEAQVIIMAIDATFKMKEQEWIQRINALESELAWAKTELFVVQTNCHEVITRMKDKEIMLLDEIRRLSHLCWMNQKLSTIPRTHVSHSTFQTSNLKNVWTVHYQLMQQKLLLWVKQMLHQCSDHRLYQSAPQ